MKHSFHSSVSNQKVLPIVVVGSGIAGLSSALFLAEYFPVILCTQGDLLSGATPLAQGGIASASLANDSFCLHYQDTIHAGEGKNTVSAVEVLVQNAPFALQALRDWGVQFETGLHREGGHSVARVWNRKDQTGKHIAKVLIKQVIAHPSITLLPHTLAYHLDSSACILSIRNTKTLECFALGYRSIIFATGGYAGLFPFSSVPVENIGGGIAVLLDAGAQAKDMSLVQFHPTILKKDSTPRMLLSEAIRGAGASIVNQEGRAIVDPLLPRNIVSKAIWEEELSGGKVFLDARMIENFSHQFPYIGDRLQSDFGLNPLQDLLPITVGAHYCMGGIATNLWGETSIPGVYAVGECACTGVHGKNRLASNSLLEGVVFSKRICTDIVSKVSESTCSPPPSSAVPVPFPLEHSDSSGVVLKNIQVLLSRYASIKKTKEYTQKFLTGLAQISPRGYTEITAFCIAKSIAEDLQHKEKGYETSPS